MALIKGMKGSLVPLVNSVARSRGLPLKVVLELPSMFDDLEGLEDGGQEVLELVISALSSTINRVHTLALLGKAEYIWPMILENN